MKTTVQMALGSLFSVTTLQPIFTQILGSEINEADSWSDITDLLTQNSGLEKLLAHGYSKTETALVALVLARSDFGTEAERMCPNFLTLASISLTRQLRQTAAIIISAD